MRRILIVTPTLRSGGGVIRGLQNMLALLPPNKYNIDVLPMGYSDGDNISLVNCNVLHDNFILTALTSIYSLTTNYKYRKQLYIAKVFLRIFDTLKKRNTVEEILLKRQASKYIGYDTVIAYQEGICSHFVQYINSSYKIAWIHCDYESWKKVNERNEENIYKQYDKIVCVSKFTLDNFTRIYPSLATRSMFIHNLLDIRFIKNSSLDRCDEMSVSENIIKILSIGRLNSVKQFHLIPKLISQLLELGATNFKWYLIGSGDDKSVYKDIYNEIELYSITEKEFVFLGAKTNPFPYIRNCDILVSTSSTEACPFVVNEARVLGVPVVSNNYPSIYELIENNVNGIICSIQDMSSVLYDLIMDKNNLKHLQEGVRKDNYNNDVIISKICNLFENQ